MARTLEILDDRLVIRLTGITRLAALSGDLEIPYEQIRSVSDEPFQVPAWTWRMGGTAVPFTEILEGHFIHGHDRYFFSFERRDQTITLELEGHPYRVIVIGVEDPSTAREAIAARCPRLAEPHEVIPARAPEGRGDEVAAPPG
jgi:hypothetical protein